MDNVGVYNAYLEYFMTIWYSLWSFGIFFSIWYIWTKKNLATLHTTTIQISFQMHTIMMQIRLQNTSYIHKILAGWNDAPVA
jgi:hypothetical protein